MPLSRLRNRTDALATAAPEGSVTTPCTLPLYCAKAARLESSKKKGTRKNRRLDGSMFFSSGVNDFSRMGTAYIALPKPVSRSFLFADPLLYLHPTSFSSGENTQRQQQLHLPAQKLAGGLSGMTSAV